MDQRFITIGLFNMVKFIVVVKVAAVVVDNDVTHLMILVCVG